MNSMDNFDYIGMISDHLDLFGITYLKNDMGPWGDFMFVFFPRRGWQIHA